MLKTVAHVTSLLSITSFLLAKLELEKTPKKEAEVPKMPNMPVARQLGLCHQRYVCLKTADHLPLLDTMIPFLVGMTHFVSRYDVAFTKIFSVVCEHDALLMWLTYNTF